MKTDKVNQSVFARLFGRSQAWVSNAQTRAIDPMPRDLDAARAWGLRLGILGATSAASPAPVSAPSLFAAPTPPSTSIELEELRLKSARADVLELKRDLETGKLLRVEVVEQREVAIAADFRHSACEYPLRARATLERHIPDAALVDRILADLQPLAAELLNKSDARQVLAGKTRDEIRAALNAWIEKVMEAIA